jgi:ABC-type Na+ efflux pump permease subunit
MNRFTRINTVWRKELIDTLRDRRTLIAMIFVPMVLYPAMMLGSLQGFELQFSRLA